MTRGVTVQLLLPEEYVLLLVLAPYKRTVILHCLRLTYLPNFKNFMGSIFIIIK